MSDYVFMDWAPVRDAYPKVAVATDAGREYVIWELQSGYQVAARTPINGLRQRKWLHRALLPTIGEAITQAEQWRWAERP